MAVAAIKRIPGKVFVKINQKVGFRFLTKFGEKGLINMGKLVPGVGAAINGGLDFVESKVIAKRAYKMFIEGDFSVCDKKKEEKEAEYIEAEIVDDNKVE